MQFQVSLDKLDSNVYTAGQSCQVLLRQQRRMTVITITIAMMLASDSSYRSTLHGMYWQLAAAAVMRIIFMTTAAQQC